VCVHVHVCGFVSWTLSLLIYECVCVCVCVCMRACACECVHLLYLSVCPSVPVCLSVCPCLSVYLSLSVCLSVHPSVPVCLSVCLSVPLCLPFPVCLSLYSICAWVCASWGVSGYSASCQRPPLTDDLWMRG